MGTYLAFSETTCNGRTTDVCMYECDPGYHTVGVHVCGPDGVFEGGECAPNRCTEGLTIEYSNTTCDGVTGDECDFECWEGYTETATHVCSINGDFRGGTCTENPPERTFCVQCREGYMGKHGLCFPCDNGWEDVEPNQVECAPCLPGYSGGDGMCAQCAYREKTDFDQIACETCADNEAVISNGQCSECPSGTQPNTSEPIFGGYWQIRAQLAERGLPSPGSYAQVRTRLQNVIDDETKGCVNCPAGKAGIDGRCAACLPGSEPDGELASCAECVEGFYSVGEICVVCPDGHGHNADQSGCDLCPPNAFGIAGICSSCETGSHPNFEKTVCVTCPIGYAGFDGLCHACDAGLQPDLRNASCDVCSNGTFHAAASANVGAFANGGSVEVSHSISFEVTGSPYYRGNMIDGVTTDPNKGWGFGGGAGPTSPRSATFTLQSESALTRLRIISGLNLTRYHVTGLRLFSTNDPAPTLDGSSWNPLEGLSFAGGSNPVGGSTSSNEITLDCYERLELFIMVRTKFFASDIAWGIDGGSSHFPNITTDGSYLDNRDYIERMWFPAGVHTFDYYDLRGPNDGWNGAFFVIYAADGTPMAGGESAIQLGVLRPGTNPVTSGSFAFTVSEEQSIGNSNCNDTIDLEFFPVGATGVRLDVIDTDLSTGNAMLNEVEIWGSSVCTLCMDGWQATSNTSSCEPCPASYAGVLGICSECDAGQHPNSARTACVDCPTGTAGIDGLCVDCLPGDEPNDARTECIACTPGEHSSEGDGCILCSVGTGASTNRSQCDSCPVGNIGVAGICIECPSGQQDDTARGACENCPPGQAGVEGVCNTCPIGGEPSPDRTTCRDCSPGMAANETSVVCYTCPNGTEPIAGAVHWDAMFAVLARETCVTCLAGWAGPFGICEQCASGAQPNGAFVARNSFGADNMTLWIQACSHSELQTVRRSHGLVHVLQPPVVNFTYLYALEVTIANHAWNEWCTEVLVNNTGSGSWDSSGSYAPEPEPEPGFVYAPGTYCHTCPTGSAGVNGICVDCLPGEAPNPAWTECTACAPGRTSIVGDVCVQCPVGRGASADRSSCVSCPAGNVGVAGICTECPSGLQDFFARGDSHSQDDVARGACELCPPGQAGIEGVCETCPLGSEPSLDRIFCSTCVPGRYKKSNTDHDLDLPLSGRLIASAWLYLQPAAYSYGDRINVWVEDTATGATAELLDASLAQNTSAASLFVQERWFQVTADITGFTSAAFRVSVFMEQTDWTFYTAPHNQSKQVYLDALTIIAADSNGVVQFTSFEQANASSAKTYVNIVCEYCHLLDPLDPLFTWDISHRLSNRVGGNIVDYNMAPPAWEAGHSGATWGGLDPGGYVRSDEVGFETHCISCGLYDADNVGVTAPFVLPLPTADEHAGSSSWAGSGSGGGNCGEFMPVKAMHGEHVFSFQDVDGTVELRLAAVALNQPPPNMLECKFCSPGTGPFDPAGNFVQNLRQQPVSCEPCPSGTAGLFGDCELCAVGRLPTADRTQCEDCPRGTAGGGESGSCPACAPGSGPSKARTECMACAAGRYSPDGVACVFCPDGHDPGETRTDCHACLPGNFGVGGLCSKCPSGKAPNTDNLHNESVGWTKYGAAGYCQATGSRYELVVTRGPLSRAEAEVLAAGRGGQLASVTTAAENECAARVAGYEPVWTGGYGRPTYRRMFGASCDAGTFMVTTAEECAVAAADAISGLPFDVVNAMRTVSRSDFPPGCFFWTKSFAVIFNSDLDGVARPTETNRLSVCREGALGSWRWTVGDNWEWVNWARPTGAMAAPEPTISGTSDGGMVLNWAGTDRPAAVPGLWHSCHRGCPWPRALLVEYAQGSRYTCVDCPWGTAGVDGLCFDCPPGTEVSLDKTFCLDCEPGYQKLDNTANVALTTAGGAATATLNIGGNAMVMDAYKAIDGIADDEENMWIFVAASVENELPLVISFAKESTIDRIMLTNALNMDNHRLTAMAMYSTLDLEPSLAAGNWTPIEPMEYIGNVSGVDAPDHRVFNSFGAGILPMVFPPRQATGVKLVVFDTDAPNKNGVLNEMGVRAYAKCEICPDGWWVVRNRTGCLPCPSNYAGSYGVCTKCASGKLAAQRGTDVNKVGNNTICELCPPGRAGIDGLCDNCGGGAKPNVNRSQCIPCEPGYYSSGGVECIVCPGGFSADTGAGGCTACAPGEIGNAGICSRCPSGSQPLFAAPTRCYDCPSGYAGIEGSCSACAPGYQPVADRTSCERCTAGRYKSQDLTSCTDCWRNSTSNAAFTWCGCDAGYYLLDPVQLDCTSSLVGGDPNGVDAPTLVEVLAELEFGYPATVYCPPISCFMKHYDVQGSNPYTATSTICTAATHATGRQSGHFIFRRNRFPGINSTVNTNNETHPHNVTSLLWPGGETTYITAESYNLSATGVTSTIGFTIDLPDPRVEPACLDINECNTKNGGCDYMSTCTNFAPGRSCGDCPAGYDGPLPIGGWAMGGRTSCIAVPQTSDTRALEAPQIPLIINGPFAALEPGVERKKFERQIQVDIALSTELEPEDVYVASLEAVQSLRERRRLQADMARLAVLRVPIKAMVTVMTTRPAFIISTLNEQMASPTSLLRMGNATNYLVEDQLIDASLVQMVCPPNTISALDAEGVCTLCRPGWELLGGANNTQPVIATSNETAATCTQCPLGQYNDLDGGFCGICDPGSEPNRNIESVRCTNCAILGDGQYSPAGGYCESCHRTERANKRQARPVGLPTWPHLAQVGCVCEVGRYNASRRPWPEPLVCADSDGLVLGTASSEFTVGRGPWCEQCPKDAAGRLLGCVDCSRDDSSADPVRGHWRTKEDSARVYRCNGGADSCFGGHEAPCIAPHDGVLCSSCNPGFVARDHQKLECSECEMSLSSLFGAVVAVVLQVGLVTLARWAERRAKASLLSPTVDDALSSGPTAHELAAICIRILISFLQMQWLLGQLHLLLFPPQIAWLLSSAGWLIDPATAVRLLECYLRSGARGEGQLPSGFLPPIGSVLLVSVCVLLPALPIGFGWCVRRMKRWHGASKEVGDKEKIVEIFRKYDADRDGLLQMQDLRRLAQLTGLEHYDGEAWEEWSAILKVYDSSIGWTCSSFERWYYSRDEGLKELEYTYRIVFPQKSKAALGAASVGSLSDEEWLAEGVDHWFSWVCVGLYVVHPALLFRLLSMFACVDLEPNLSVLRSDRGAQCYTGSWATIACLIVLPALYAFCHALPGLAVLTIRNARFDVEQALAEPSRGIRDRKIKEAAEVERHLADRYGFVTRGYRGKSALWELVITGRKAIVVWIILFIEPLGAEPQALAALLVVQSAVLFQAFKQPHIASTPHRLETLSLAVSFLTMLAAAYYHQRVADAVASDCAGSRDGPGDFTLPKGASCGSGADDELLMVLITTLVVVANLAIVTSLCWRVLHAQIGNVIARYHRAEEMRQRQKSEVAPEEEKPGRALKDKPTAQKLTTADQLKAKTDSIESAVKTCAAMIDRLGSMQEDLPELSMEVLAISGLVERLATGIGHAQTRAAAVQSKWSRGQLKAQFQAMAYNAGDSSASVLKDGNKKYWAKLFQRYDKDDSGELDFDEFRRAVRLDAKIPTHTLGDDELRQIFEWVDVDSGGSVSAEEFTKFLDSKDDLVVNDENETAGGGGGGGSGRDEEDKNQPARANASRWGGRSGRSIKASDKYLPGAASTDQPDFSSIGTRAQMANDFPAGRFGSSRATRGLKPPPQRAQGNFLQNTPKMTMRALAKVSMPAELFSAGGARGSPERRLPGTPVQAIENAARRKAPVARRVP